MAGRDQPAPVPAARYDGGRRGRRNWGVSTAMRDWFGAVLAVEPSEVMRARILQEPGALAIAGSAEELPIEDSSVDGAWLVHGHPPLHQPGLDAAELRRVRPGGPVLIRNFFPGGAERIGLLRFFPRVPTSALHVPDGRADGRGVHRGWVRRLDDGVGCAADRTESGCHSGKA
jgi:hypothetical protein